MQVFTARVRGGELLESIRSYRRLGWTEAKILASYPTVRAADLVHAWAYVDTHRQEIDEEIRRNESA